jgi:hypothetical protein
MGDYFLFLYSIFIIIDGKNNTFLCVLKMSEQTEQEQSSSEQSVSLTLCEKQQKESILLQLIADLVQGMQSLYESNSLSPVNLNQIFKKILSDFYQRDDIPKVDTFAILNSFRKMKEIPFEHDSKKWTFYFSKETSLTSGKTEMTITVESSMIIGIFRTIIDRLDPIQQDLLFLMYRSILREREVSPKIPNFELTIEQDYQFWCDSLEWKTQRNKFLLKCKYEFIRQPFFSKKDTKFYLDELSRSSGYPFTPESFREFLGRYYIKSNSVLDFEPMF